MSYVQKVRCTLKYEQKRWIPTKAVGVILLGLSLISLMGCTARQDRILLEAEVLTSEEADTSGPDTEGMVADASEGPDGKEAESGSRQAETEADATSGTEVTTEEMSDYIFVHVCGCVAEPGVYKLRSDARVVDAISAAGGMSQGAATDFLNLAAPVYDGEKIQVPSQEEAASAGAEDAFTELSVIPATADGGSESVTSAADGKVNLNTATLEELMTLSGIGEGKAQSIINYRELHDGFDTLEELTEVDGIGDTTFEKLKEQICL